MKTFGLFTLVIMLTVSCKPTSKTEEQQIKGDTINEEIIAQQINTIVYSFPSSRELFNDIKEEDLHYDEELLNSHEQAKNYLTSEKQALNMGVFLMDMEYANFFDNTEQSREYLFAALLLSDKLSLTIPHNEPFFKKLEKNKGNIDSLKAVVNSASSYLSNWILNNERPQVFGMVSLGSFIEFLYISMNSIGDYSESDESIQRFIELKYNFENLFEYIQLQQKDSEYPLNEIDISSLKEAFNQLEETTSDAKLEKNIAGKLSFSGGAKLHITKEQYTNLKNVVTEIRNKIIATNS